jgi:hypothetical protein
VTVTLLPMVVAEPEVLSAIPPGDFPVNCTDSFNNHMVV